MKSLILFLSVLPACGQILSFGLIGGGIASDGVDPGAGDTWSGKRYTVGVRVEAKLPAPRLSVEVDALYRRAGQGSGDCAFTSCFVSELRANLFEFPVMAKYRLLKRAPVAPFVSAGVAYQWV